MNTQQRHAVKAIQTNCTMIQRLAAQERKGSSQKRKHTIEACYSSVVLHAHKLRLTVPPLGTFYRPEVYIANCDAILLQLPTSSETSDPPELPEA